jgi:hypothetical protein
MARPFVLVFFALVVALLALGAWRGDVPEIEIRYEPRQTHVGRIFPGHPLGQGFTCERDGLNAIDVQLVPIGGRPSALTLVLRVGEPDGAVVRTARIESADLPPTDLWGRFEFDPIRDSSGQRFYFELISPEVSAHSPWVRYRGVPYVIRPWGDQPITGATLEGDFQSMPPRLGRPDILHSNLSALAFAVDGLDAAAGPATLTLLDEEGGVVRTSQLSPRVPHATSWAFFAFDPIETSRFATYRFRLELPPEARLVGTSDGPSAIAFHGTGELDSRLLGMTAAGEVLEDRDLVFRARSDEGYGIVLFRLFDHGGEALVVAALFWVIGVAGVGALLRRTTWSQTL